MSHPYPRSLRRRVEILKSAAAAFRTRGYHATSVDDIAQTLRMTKGSLYYYFKNKEEILYVCHDHTLDLLLRVLRDIQATDQSPADKLRAVIAAVPRGSADGTPVEEASRHCRILSASHR